MTRTETPGRTDREPDERKHGVRTVTLNAGNNWTAKVTGLAKKANGTDIAYSWSEGSMPTGYSLTDTSVDGTVNHPDEHLCTGRNKRKCKEGMG